jgi:hypothetical protein
MSDLHPFNNKDWDPDADITFVSDYSTGAKEAASLEYLQIDTKIALGGLPLEWVDHIRKAVHRRDYKMAHAYLCGMGTVQGTALAVMQAALGVISANEVAAKEAAGKVGSPHKPKH